MKLRTNHSDDDLVCKDKIEPIQSHKATSNLKSIIKKVVPEPSKSVDKSQSSPLKAESVSKPQVEMMKKSSPVKSPAKSQNQEVLQQKIQTRPKSELSKPSQPIEVKGKNEPLVIYDALDDDDDEKAETPVAKTNSHGPENKEKLIEDQYNSGAATHKFFVPKREIANRTE